MLPYRHYYHLTAFFTFRYLNTLSVLFFCICLNTRRKQGKKGFCSESRHLCDKKRKINSQWHCCGNVVQVYPIFNVRYDYYNVVGDSAHSILSPSLRDTRFVYFSKIDISFCISLYLIGLYVSLTRWGPSLTCHMYNLKPQCVLHPFLYFYYQSSKWIYPSEIDKKDESVSGLNPKTKAKKSDWDLSLLHIYPELKKEVCVCVWFCVCSTQPNTHTHATIHGDSELLKLISGGLIDTFFS